MVKSKASKAVDWIIVGICSVIILVCLLHVLNVLSRSLSSSDALIRNRVYIWPVGWNLTSYKHILSDPKYTNSLWWTALLTLICTVISMVMTTLCAYPLIYKGLKGRKIINTLVIFTMYFSAGTIRNYLLIKDLGLL